eukprot:CAMPEP_0170390222 /NCGR_PEP_ID=MMETSP0117_2-20130122/19029_1 /TAXON_ID=400756 /ORGANISM="Durinskia baltica, Strain CSIRO CS-38" /LENGTH=500 /DNA_ID=CAMNT_0010646249 /DNA_START=46 /DNA_END=1548 /DNA_ORIENTATION=-
MSLTNNKAALFGKGSATASLAPAVSVTKTSSTAKTSTSANTTSAAVAAAKAKKISEAEEYRQKAENYLKTSFLQWKPDYVASAPMFERAADLYKQADDMLTASEMMLKAAQSHEGYNALASVAVANTKAATLLKAAGPGQEKRVAELLLTAAEFWGLSGDIQKYGETTAKAAKEMEDVNSKEAKATYEKSVSILCPDNQPTSPIAVEIFRNFFSFLVRKRMLDDAIALSSQMVKVMLASELDSSAFKVLASVTVIQLAQGDSVKAQQTYLQEHMNIPGYLQSRECVLADDLTMAFSSEDLDKLDKAKRSPEMHYLDYEVQQLGKALTLFDPVFLAPAPAQATAPARSAAKASPVQSNSSGGGGKSDLFGKSAPPPLSATQQTSPSARAAGRPAPPPPPPLPPAPKPEEAGEADEEEAEEEEHADLDGLHIDDDAEEGEDDDIAGDRKERNYGEFTGVITDSARSASGEEMMGHLSAATTEALLNQQQQQTVDEDDELDLS